MAETLEQFFRRGRRRADFADDDAGGVVGKYRRFNRRCARRNRQRETGNDRVACAGNIEDFLRHRRDVKWFVSALAEQHSKFAERDEQQRGIQFFQQPFRDEHEISVCEWIRVLRFIRQIGQLKRLFAVRRDEREAFELADLPDETKNANPFADKNLMLVAERLLKELNPALLLVTLGELGMLLCQRGHKPFHIPTVAQEVFDVSGAGDTVIASFTLAIAAGASPIEAAILSNHAAGIVVGKVGTATTTPEELLKSFNHR